MPLIALVVYVAFYSAHQFVDSFRCLELCGHCRGFDAQGSLVQSSFESTRLRHAPDTGESTGEELIMGKGPIALPHRPDEDSQHQPESNEEQQQKFYKTTAKT